MVRLPVVRAKNARVPPANVLARLRRAQEIDRPYSSNLGSFTPYMTAHFSLNPGKTGAHLWLLRAVALALRGSLITTPAAPNQGGFATLYWCRVHPSLKMEGNVAQFSVEQHAL